MDILSSLFLMLKSEEKHGRGHEDSESCGDYLRR